jgi:hypothetical protein
MRKIAFATAVAAATLALAAFAQPGTGPGPGPGPGAGPGYGMGAGPRAGAGPRFDETTTPGWSMMSAEERSEHQARMRSFKSYEECNAYMAQHHDLMAERAKEKGTALRGAGPGPACDWLKK